MDLTPYVASLGRELLSAVENGGDDPTTMIERLTVSMESAIRLTLLETLSAAADEITRDLAPGSVQVRLRGRDPELVVIQGPAEQPAVDTADHDAAPAMVSTVRYERAPAAINPALSSRTKAVNWLRSAGGTGSKSTFTPSTLRAFTSAAISLTARCRFAALFSMTGILASPVASQPCIATVSTTFTPRACAALITPVMAALFQPVQPGPERMIAPFSSRTAS